MTRATRSSRRRATWRPPAPLDDVSAAIYAYNHAGWYVDMVLTRARTIAASVRPTRQSISRRGIVSVFFATAQRRHPTLRFRGGVMSHYDRLIAAANMVSAANFPYLYGGGHEQPARFGPFDCSGSVSYVMQQAGYKVPTTVSGDIPIWKFPTGPGRVTIFYNPTHTFMRIGNRYFGTSGFARGATGGAGWFDTSQIPESYLADFSEVHVPHLGVNSFAPRHVKASADLSPGRSVSTRLLEGRTVGQNERSWRCAPDSRDDVRVWAGACRWRWSTRRSPAPPSRRPPGSWRARSTPRPCSKPAAPAWRRSPLVAVGYAAELLSVIAVDLAADPRETRRLVASVSRVAGLPPVALGREVLQTGRLLELPVDVAIEVRLALLLAFTDARAVTLWTLPLEGQIKLISRAGQPASSPDEGRDAALELLRDSGPPAAEGICAVRIERLRPPQAALVAEGIPTGKAGGHSTLLLSAAAPVLSALLDREALIGREPPAQDAVLSSVQRRLARLRFDLHDGPQQDIHLLAQDLGLFREQLRPMVAGDPNADRLLGRLDDLEAQLVALDGDLRRLSSAVQSPLLVSGSLPEALRSITDAFAARTGVEPDVRISGNLDSLTDSQQIALLSLIREALSNIRKHSDAGRVTITVGATPEGVQAEVTDDGKGFEPEPTLVQAARAGRLGLVGMHERVRMLGGRTQIDSRPGGPTVISATLPPWPTQPEACGRRGRPGRGGHPSFRRSRSRARSAPRRRGWPRQACGRCWSDET